jgi:hypothetical protein
MLSVRHAGPEEPAPYLIRGHPDVVPTEVGNYLKDWLPVFTGNPGFRLEFTPFLIRGRNDEEKTKRIFIKQTPNKKESCQNGRLTMKNKYSCLRDTTLKPRIAKDFPIKSAGLK